MLTIEEAIKIGGLAKGEVIAGWGGVYNQVSSISVLEVTSPDVVKWINGGELFITSFYSIADNIEKQIEIIEILHEKSCAGLVICSMNFYLKQISSEVTKRADDLNVPLIIVPSDMKYVDIITPLMDKILLIQKADLQFALNLQIKLYNFILADQDIHDLIETLGQLIGKSIVIFDCDFVCLTKYELLDSEVETLREVVKNNFLFINEKQRQEDSRIISYEDKLIYPIVLGNEFYGFAVILPVREESEKILLAINQAIIAISLMLTKKRRLKDIYKTSKIDFIADLMSGNFSNEQIVKERAISFGWDLDNKHNILVCNLDDFYINGLDKYKNRKANKHGYINFSRIEEIILEENAENIFGYRSDLIIILLNGYKPENNNSRLKKLGKKIVEYGKLNNFNISIGVSDYFGQYQGIPTAYSQSIQAIRLGRIIFGRGKVVFYSDLGLYKYLYDMSFNESVNICANNLLEELRDYDLKNNSNLVDTLRILLEYNSNIKDTADTLYIHKNTVFYRLNRIIKILGHDPLEKPYKLQYELAFLIKKLSNTYS